MNIFRNILTGNSCIRAFVRIFCFLCLTACTSDGECRKDVKVELITNLCKNVYDNVSESYIEKTLQVTQDTITVFGLGNDSLIANEISIPNVSLTLKNFSDTTSFVFQLKNQSPDTVNFICENEDNFISLECGNLVFHRIKDVQFSRYNIDSVRIINNYVAIGNNGTNIKIYFRNR
ncbi:MAG: hypothetical protein LBS50_00575 [Prevotellaceae bacterium]|jgi:hypothetical protein|nr:hypothetical protein [Prevotellaceae bacterium]